MTSRLLPSVRQVLLGVALLLATSGYLAAQSDADFLKEYGWNYKRPTGSSGQLQTDYRRPDPSSWETNAATSRPGEPFRVGHTRSLDSSGRVDRAWNGERWSPVDAAPRVVLLQTRLARSGQAEAVFQETKASTDETSTFTLLEGKSGVPGMNDVVEKILLDDCAVIVRTGDQRRTIKATEPGSSSVDLDDSWRGDECHQRATSAMDRGYMRAAAQLYRRAADLGNVKSQANLGAMLLQGRGVTRDLDQAFIWLSKAAASGSTPAMYNLGLLFEQPGRQDLAKAQQWYEKALGAGFERARVKLQQLATKPLPSAVPSEARNAEEVVTAPLDLVCSFPERYVNRNVRIDNVRIFGGVKRNAIRPALGTHFSVMLTGPGGYVASGVFGVTGDVPFVLAPEIAEKLLAQQRGEDIPGLTIYCRVEKWRPVDELGIRLDLWLAWISAQGNSPKNAARFGGRLVMT